MSFRGDERAEMRGRAEGEMRGWGQLWTNSSSAVEPQPRLISADIIRSCSVLSFLWVRVFVMTPRTRDGHIASQAAGYETLPKTLWDVKAGCLLICLLRLPFPQPCRWAHSGPLSANCSESACERAAPYMAPRHRTCEYLMPVVNCPESCFCCYEQSDKKK